MPSGDAQLVRWPGLAIFWYASFSQVLDSVDEVTMEQFITLVYAVREQRNARGFENRELEVGHVLARMEALRSLPRPAAVPRVVVEQSAGWTRPAPRWVKLI